MFYLYKQNNSGGIWQKDRFVDRFVFIEAKSVKDACKRAERIGIYFDGVSTGFDCDCCGDRWSTPYDGMKNPRVYGHKISIVAYGKHNAIIHYKNGKIAYGHSGVSW